MDTNERQSLFEQYRAEGWSQQYLSYRKRWEEFPKNNEISDFPLLVDIEISSICNLHCPMCYTITKEFKKKVKATLMRFELFVKIIDEIANRVPAIRLSLRGEPLLHERILDCIRYSKSKGIKEVSMLTNGSKLNPEMSQSLVEAGLDWLTISIDGINEIYERIRKPLRFSDTLQKLKDLQIIKNKLKTHKPVVKVQGIWPAIRNNPSDYYNTLAPYTDLIAYNPLIDYLSNDKEIVYVDNFVCPQQYQRLVIGADGLAMMCSNDEENTVIIGNANTETIYQIWHSENLNKIREIQQKTGGFKEIPVCKKCYLPRATDDHEFGIVNGHGFVVKNYINRDQQIGK